MGSSKEDVRRVSIYINGDAADLTLSQLTQGTTKLKNELSRLTIGTEEYRQKMHQLAESRAVLADVKADIDKISLSLQASKNHAEGTGHSLETLKEGFETLGIGLSVAELISFGKELLDIEVKASGVERAFTRIGDTEGLLEKLKKATNGMLTDMDLEKLAVQANHFQVPLSKLPMLLEFATQRARDMDKPVDELADKLITGLGRKGGRALVELGISVQEFNAELQVTPDRVDAIANIIQRRMGEAGQDMDNFGDRIKKDQTRWENFKESLAKGWEKISDLVNMRVSGPDNEEIQEATNREMKKFEALKKLKGEELAAQLQIDIKSQEQYIKKLAEEAKKINSIYEKDHTTEGLIRRNKARAENDLASIAAQNALGALNNQSANAAQKEEEEGKPGTIKYIEQKIKALRELQTENAITSAAYLEQQKKIDALEKQKDAITGKKPKTDKSAEEARHAQEEYLAQSKALDAKLKEFNASELADTLSKNDKEVAALEEKYNKEWTEATAALTKLRQSKNANEQQIQQQQDQIDELAGQKAVAVNLLREKQEKDITEKIKALRAHLSDKIVAETQREIDEINQKFDALSKDAGNDPIAQAQIDAGRQAAINDAKLNEATRFAKEMERIQAEANVDDSPAGKKTRLAEVDKKYAAELAALKANYTLEFQATVAFHDAVDKLDKNRSAAKKKIEEADRKSYEQKAIDTAQNISNIVFSNERDAREEEMSSQLKNLETEKNAQLSAKNLTAKQKADIEAKFAAQEADIKRKNWEANKMAMAEQALMNGALGLIKLWVDPGFPAAIPLAIGLGAEVAVQEAAILSQKTPAFAEGGYSAVDYTNPSGWVRRPTLFANSSSGRPFIAGEGNKSEYIVSSQQLRDPVVANFVGMMESNRTVKHFESGGYSSTGGSSSSASSNQGSDRLDKVEYLLHTFIEKQAAINEIPVTFNTRAHDLYTARITQITTKATT